MFCLSCRNHIPNTEKSTLISFSGTELIDFCVNCNFGVTKIESEESSLGFRRFGFTIELLMTMFRFWRATSISIRHRLRRGLSVLDYGCGRGDFLNYMRFFGWNVIGTENSCISAADARKRKIPILLHGEIGDSFQGKGSFSSFDLITSYHSLEHLPDPVKFLAQCKQSLKKFGTLVVEVPNIDSWQYKISGENWILLDVENHKFHFSVKSLHHLLHKSGFKVKKISTFSMNYGIIGMADGIRCWILRLISVRRRLSPRKIAQKSLLPSPFWIFLLLPVALFVEIFGSIFKRGSVIRIYACGSSDEINNTRLRL